MLVSAFFFESDFVLTSLYLMQYFFLMHSAHFSDRATFYYAGPSAVQQNLFVVPLVELFSFKKIFFSNAVENNRFDKYC